MVKLLINKIGIILLSLLLILLSGCGSGSSSPPATEGISPQEYVAEVLQIMRENAITKYQVDWPQLETEVTNLAASATTISQTRRALERALLGLNTNHSFIRMANGEVIYVSDIVCGPDEPITPLEHNEVGYIHIPGFSGSSTQAVEFANGKQEEIRGQDNENIRGWVVDLRNNSGGNMYPMIAGVAPLLQEGIFGYFVDADENFIPFGFQDGASFWNFNPSVEVNTPYQVINSLPKIAVLSNNATVSSGEATMIAFKKVPNVRFFGDLSCGLSTGNSIFELSDGSQLILTTSIDADREMEKYGAKIPVDEGIPNDEVLDRAVEWILGE
ncbi:MAG: S41 family peptidase [Kangiellaceae bacterium]|nr:S41 family peptidase [Kangiellaceae bacterium]MCW8998922.1 S41 family peptidase [Kangiellaceae bacterium]MCW9015860.1 S41 family peptidase [Kangiellaceae bacterium]